MKHRERGGRAEVAESSVIANVWDMVMAGTYAEASSYAKATEDSSSYADASAESPARSSDADD